MDKLLLVDGSNLLFQMFFGMPARIKNKSGKAIHGTIGFIGALLKIIRLTNPTHIAVFFDGEHENERVNLNAEYKANRIDYSEVAEDENPFSQLPDIYAALDYLKIKHTETTVCETDDWIAAYSAKYGGSMQIIISSFDSDYFQLLTENISVLRYRGEKSAILSPQDIISRFGVQPEQYAGFKSLVGDNSDNVKGAEKIGPKTAACLLNQFGTLENIILNAESIGKQSAKESILKNEDRLRTNYKIIKLSGEADLPFGLEDLINARPKISSTETLKNTGLLP